MTLTIELSPEHEARLRETAAQNGLEPSEYVRQLIEQQIEPAYKPTQPPGTSLWERLSPEQWRRQTREWTESHRDLPLLSDEAVSRESFYEDRE